MAAGAANVHIGMLVVAADDGIMPQTKEHLQILDSFSIQGGLVVLTKVDIVNDEEWIDLVELELQALIKNTVLNGAPIICLLYTSPSPRDATLSRMPSSA